LKDLKDDVVEEVVSFGSTNKPLEESKQAKELKKKEKRMEEDEEYYSNENDSEYSDDSEEDEEDTLDSFNQFSDYTADVVENLQNARDKYYAMSILECDNLLVEFFKSNKGKYVNYSKIEEKERLKIMYVALGQFRQNISTIDYIKRKIYVVQCPQNPRFKRSAEDMSDLSMDTIKKLEEIMELFSNFYLEIVDQLPEKMHKSVNLVVSEKLILGEEVLKRLRKKSTEAKELFTKLDKEYGDIFVKLNHTQCDVKDYMNFFNLLPRFLYVYRNLQEEFKKLENPYIKYASNLIKNLSFDWRERMNSMFKSVQFINFFIIYTKMVFELVQVTNDPLEIIKPLEGFLNLYNMNNYTFAAISNLRKDFLSEYDDLKSVFVLLENNWGLNTMPFPVFDDHPELFDSTQIFKISFFGFILLWLFNKD